jgi:hypothetical protein
MRLILGQCSVVAWWEWGQTRYTYHDSRFPVGMLRQYITKYNQKHYRWDRVFACCDIYHQIQRRCAFLLNISVTLLHVSSERLKSTFVGMLTMWVSRHHNRSTQRYEYRYSTLILTPWSESASELYRPSDPACRRNDCQLLRIEGATWSAWRIPTAVFSVL